MMKKKFFSILCCKKTCPSIQILRICVFMQVYICIYVFSFVEKKELSLCDCRLFKQVLLTIDSYYSSSQSRSYYKKSKRGRRNEKTKKRYNMPNDFKYKDFRFYLHTCYTMWIRRRKRQRLSFEVFLLFCRHMTRSIESNENDMK